jgi:hypothetical protein
MDFCGSSASSEFIKAIDLGVNIGDIIAGQTIFRFEDIVIYIYREREK